MDTTLDFSLDKKERLSQLRETAAVLLTHHAGIGRPLPRPIARQPLSELCWNARYSVGRLLGEGAQGTVYLATREGVDGYFTPVALKVFHRPPTWSLEEYVAEMRRIALQARHVSQIQHDSLISIRDFVALEETRVMVLEWIDGVDLQRLLNVERMNTLLRGLPKVLRDHLTEVIVTPGQHGCRLKAGIAVDILRGCLAGLSALHRKGIVHCDLKPSNIMIKHTGTKKIIDMDSSVVLTEDSRHSRGTPYYMAPEQLQDQSLCLQSDLASLGYILLEMLTGQMLFPHCQTPEELLAAKTSLPKRLHQVLPMDVLRDPILHELIRKMIAVDPRDRFPDATAAELDDVGAASFHRHLVKTNLSTEYDRELAWWLGLNPEGAPLLETRPPGGRFLP